MRGIARFMRVSPSQLRTDWEETFPGLSLPKLPRLPRRATEGSAGYDFFSPLSFQLSPGESMRIPTGVRVRIDSGWVLMLFPRSGLGFRHRLQLDNTVGIVDSDYFGAKNEGHIFVKLTNAGQDQLSVDEGEAFVQGVFVPFGLTEDDDAAGERVGGFGSTGLNRVHS